MVTLQNTQECEIQPGLRAVVLVISPRQDELGVGCHPESTEGRKSARSFWQDRGRQRRKGDCWNRQEAKSSWGLTARSAWKKGLAGEKRVSGHVSFTSMITPLFLQLQFNFPSQSKISQWLEVSITKWGHQHSELSLALLISLCLNLLNCRRVAFVSRTMQVKY